MPPKDPESSQPPGDKKSPPSSQDDGSSKKGKPPSTTSSPQQNGCKDRKEKPLSPIEKILGESVVNAQSETRTTKSLVSEDGVLGLYFGARWCPPCRAITPEIVRVYNEVRNAGKSLEIVFISLDSDGESFKEYFSKMPWWAVDFNNEEKIEEIAQYFKIKGIPILMFLDPKTMEVITKEGKDIVLVDPKGDLYPWKDLPEPLICLVVPDPFEKFIADTAAKLAQKEGGIEEGNEKEENQAVDKQEINDNEGTRKADDGDDKTPGGVQDGGGSSSNNVE